MKSTNTVKIKNILVGGSWPIAIQTMWKKKIEDFKNSKSAIINELHEFKKIGCNIIRFAVPKIEDAEVLGELSKETSIAIVADIHFDYKIALRCLDFPIAKIRVNPGNIGASWKVKEVLTKAKDKSVPIRIGVNAGSLPTDLRDYEDISLAMLKATERELEFFEKYNFKDIVVSLKSSDVNTVISVNREFAKKYSYPLHLGVTEAGPLIAGVARNAYAIATLLKENIGATIRVSLSDSELNEIIAGREILSCVDDKAKGVRIISCPKCGRASFDTHEFTKKWMPKLMALNKNITVAIMGCVVNGPGEARHADIGITGAGDKLIIFRKGGEKRVISLSEADNIFSEELSKF